MTQLVRHNGKWIKLMAKPYEPDRQTHELVWSMITTNTPSPDAYRRWYSGEQKKVSVLYPSFRKETHGT